MRKYIFSVSFIFLITCGLFAQDVKFGFRGGLNIANMSVAKSTPVSEGYKSRLAPGWGLFTELQITCAAQSASNPKVSLRFGVEYSGMGGKKDGMQALPTQRLISEMASSMGGGILGMSPELQAGLGQLMAWSKFFPHYYANVENTTKFDYVMIPVVAQFGWNLGQSPWRVYVNAGPFVSFLLSGKLETKGKSYLYSDASGTTTLWNVFPEEAKNILASQLPDIFPAIEQTLDSEKNFDTTKITGEMKSANFGVTGNVGIRYQCKHNYFFLEVGGNYGFFTVQQNDANGSNRIGAASVMAGYAFSLF